MGDYWVFIAVPYLFLIPMFAFFWWLVRRRIDSTWTKVLISSLLLGTLLAPTGVAAGHGAFFGPAVHLGLLCLLELFSGRLPPAEMVLYVVAPILVVSAAIFFLQAIVVGVSRMVAPPRRPIERTDDRFERRLRD